LQAIVGGINFMVTLLLSIWLLDRVGRKPLLQWSYTAMAVMYVVLALFAPPAGSHHSHFRTLALLTIIAIVVAFAVGPGPVTWVMPVELFPLTVRTQMLSICVCGMSVTSDKAWFTAAVIILE
jgi:MFS family permease